MTARWRRRERKREAARRRMQKHGRSLLDVMRAIESRAKRPKRGRRRGRSAQRA